MADDNDRLEALRDALLSTDDPEIAGVLGDMVGEQSAPADDDPAPPDAASQAKAKAWLHGLIRQRLGKRED